MSNSALLQSALLPDQLCYPVSVAAPSARGPIDGLAALMPDQHESRSIARKPVDPFLKFTLTHLARQKSEPRLGVGRWPIVACEFKRAGFLEGETIGTSLLIGLEPASDQSSVVAGREPAR